MSWQLAVLRVVLRQTVRPVVARLQDWAFARRVFRVSARLAFRRDRACDAHPPGPGTGPGLSLVPRELPRGGHGDGIILYLHGGAYIVGGPDSYRPLAARLAAQAGRRLLLPDYPLAPEHPAPAAFDAALSAWDGLRAEGHAAGRIAIGGDSAGGGLALALLAHLLARGERPAGCFAFSPWTDLALTGASLQTNAARDVLLPAGRLEEVRDLVRGTLAPDDPRLSPLHARFPNCPAVFLSWSDTEILRDDGRRMADLLRAEGADVTCDVLPDAPHVWQLFHGRLPEADASIARATAFIAAVLPSSPAAGS